MSATNQDIRHRLLLARLPAMPQILLKLLELCQTDEAGMAEFAQLIRKDAGISAKVLRVASSAAYHRGSQPADLFQALNVLGTNSLKMLVISESVFQTLNGFPHASGLDLHHFWKHTLTTAVMARELARKTSYPQPEEAYLAGLLHDVGRLALLAAAPNEYSASFRSADDQALCASEQRTLQITHAEAGAWLIGRWNLDSFIADSVLYHHEPAARLQAAHPLIRIVHLADLLSQLVPEAGLPDGINRLCPVSDEDIHQILQETEAQVSQEADLLGIDLSRAPDRQPAPIAVLVATTNPTQQRLDEEVRNMTLTAELGRSLSLQQDESKLLELVQQSANILFGLEGVLVFLLDQSQQQLVCASAGGQWQRLSGFSVPLAGGGNLAESVLQRRTAFINREHYLPSLAEEQLLRVFGSDCLVCVPLASGSQCLGVMVGGLAVSLLTDLKRQERLLQSFGAKAAAALETTRRQRKELQINLSRVQEQHTDNARRVAHEVNNPLAIIKNYLGVLDDKLRRQEMPGDELVILSQEIDRVGHLIHEFAEASTRPQTGHTDINRVTGDLVRLFQDSGFLPPAARISTRLSGQRAVFNGPADTLKQILMNLLKNAVEALPRGGHIEITSSGPVYQDGRAFFELQIQDDGPGMPQDVLSHLFSPVPSHKEGKRRGLGLSIVNELLKKAGGLINCTSSSAGTTFKLLLPADPTLTASTSHTPHKEKANG